MIEKFFTSMTNESQSYAGAETDVCQIEVWVMW
jgi:hypothetical protein